MTTTPTTETTTAVGTIHPARADADGVQSVSTTLNNTTSESVSKPRQRSEKVTTKSVGKTETKKKTKTKKSQGGALFDGSGTYWEFGDEVVRHAFEGKVTLTLELPVKHPTVATVKFEEPEGSDETTEGPTAIVKPVGATRHPDTVTTPGLSNWFRLLCRCATIKVSKSSSRGSLVFGDAPESQITANDNSPLHGEGLAHRNRSTDPGSIHTYETGTRTRGRARVRGSDSAHNNQPQCS